MGENLGPSPEDMGMSTNTPESRAAEAAEREGLGQSLARQAERIQSAGDYSGADALRQRALPHLEAAAIHRIEERLANSEPGSGAHLEAQADIAEYKEGNHDKAVALRQQSNEAKRREFLNRSNQ